MAFQEIALPRTSGATTAVMERLHELIDPKSRGFLPLGSGPQALSITRYDHDVVRLLDRIAGHHEFERYVGEVPFEFKD